MKKLTIKQRFVRWLAHRNDLFVIPKNLPVTWDNLTIENCTASTTLIEKSKSSKMWNLRQIGKHDGMELAFSQCSREVYDWNYDRE